MFTGIIERLGEVVAFESARLTIRPHDDPRDWRIGESIAIDGCCLTVVNYDGDLAFDVSPETLAKTTFTGLKPGRIVNLERCMRADGRFEGHIVQGHVETTGHIHSIEPGGNAQVFRFLVPQQFTKYLIEKGSVAVDGISLTVVNLEGARFDAWIIPHTLANTNLGTKKAGDAVNLEFDLVAKYVERLLHSQ